MAELASLQVVGRAAAGCWLLTSASSTPAISKLEHTLLAGLTTNGKPNAALPARHCCDCCCWRLRRLQTSNSLQWQPMQSSSSRAEGAAGRSSSGGGANNDSQAAWKIGRVSYNRWCCFRCDAILTINWQRKLIALFYCCQSIIATANRPAGNWRLAAGGPQVAAPSPLAEGPSRRQRPRALLCQVSALHM